MSDELAAVDSRITELNAQYRRDGYVLVRKRKISLHYCDRDGQAIGRPLMRFEASLVPGLEDAHGEIWARVLEAQEEDGND